jgi:uncharacterized phiE125 gp8 family phage protein
MSNIVSYAIITLSELKEAIGLSTTADDAMLNGMINRATDMIETYCKRRFISTTYTDEVYSGDGSNSLLLRNYPITALTSLQSRGGLFDSPAWDSVETDLFSLNQAGGLDKGVIYMAAPFVQGDLNFRVTYTAGYANQAAIPHDLREACIEIASFLYGRRKATPGMKSETLGRYGYTMETVTPGMSTIDRLGLKDILAAYRSITV